MKNELKKLVTLRGAIVMETFRDNLFDAANRSGMTANEFVLYAAAEKLIRAGKSFSGVFHPKDMGEISDSIHPKSSGRMVDTSIIHAPAEPQPDYEKMRRTIHGENGSERRLLRTEEAATYTALSEAMLRKLRLAGSGPEYIKLGRVVVYDPNDLEKWIAANRRRATSVEI